MEEELLKKFEQIKKEMVISFTKLSLSREEEKNQDAVLSSVLYSWFMGVESVEDFQKKYKSFKQLEKMIQNSSLFDLVEMIPSSKDPSQALKAVSIYENLVKEEEYQKNTSSCGYKLPMEFGEKRFYLDGSLEENVKFFHLFTDRLDHIYHDLSKKGVVRR